MRWLTLIFVALIVLLQYPLWFGKGGWLKVWDYQRQLVQLKEGNQKLEVRNAGLDAEVRDLKQGYEAIEERARFELGLIKEGEVFVQLPEQGNPQAVPSAPAVSANEPPRKAAIGGTPQGGAPAGR
jgi:cell division protein FtsB